MKILTLHCDYITFKSLKKALKSIKDLSEKDKKEKTVKEPLVVLMAVEQGDSEKEFKEMLESVKKTASEVKAENIVVYPYAHLSSNLSDPKTAQEFLDKSQKELKKLKFKVEKAPFGYYKQFELKVKGHPLSELSKKFGEEKVISVNETKEEEIDPTKLLRQISKSKLDTSKLKDNDHRIIGSQLDLFSFHDVAPGMVFWHDGGLTIRNELIDYWREVHKKFQYQEIKTPQVLDSKLWKISGHWKLYKENMFLTDYEGREFAVKPMNCPGGMLVFKSTPKSYKDLPLRVGELGEVHRKELSGVLAGMFRVIQFTQDDAHIFCTEDQLEDEIVEVVKIIEEMIGKFGFKYRFTLSVRSKEKKDKYLGDDKVWNKTEGAIKKALKKLKIKFDVEPGEAKFYGPSLDVQIKDSLGREWQCSTIQLDSQLPERFDLEYIGKDNKPHRPIMLHRVIYGSLERFIGVLLEHTNGNLPLWISPNQVRVLSFTDRNIKASEKILEKLKEAGIRADGDFDSTTINDKVRTAELKKIPYIITIGDKEEEKGTLAVRERGKKVKFDVSPDDLIEELKSKIEDRE